MSDVLSAQIATAIRSISEPGAAVAEKRTDGTKVTDMMRACS